MQARRGFAWLLLSLALLCGCGKRSEKPPALDHREPEDEVTGAPLFEDVTATSGVQFTYRNGEDSADHLSILESLGGGAGLLDYDGDGLLDVFLPGGGFFTGKDKKDIVGAACRLYRNLGGGKFRDVTAAVGLDRKWFYTHGVAVADYDRDGWPDLLVTGWGGVALLRNVKGQFEDVTAQAGLARGIDWATSAAFADLDGDGYPDLYVCQYVNWSFQNHPIDCNYDGKTRDVCPPKAFAGLPHRLYRNTGQGSFVEVGSAAGLHPGGPEASKGLGVVIVDVDGDGKPDVYVANDTVDNFLYINRSKPGQLAFSDQGLTSGTARDERGAPNGSMGVDAGDPERQGKPALFVTNYENEPHALYRNECKPGRILFHFASSTTGISTIGRKYVGWGTAFVDADRDGWEDLFFVAGHAIRYPPKDVGRQQLPVLLLNRQARFRRASKMIGDYHRPHLGRGVAFGDLDNDGRLDFVANHTNEPAAVVRGVGGQGCNWLGIQLVGKNHACTVGAKVVLEVDGQKQTRFRKGGSSYASASDSRLLFGLGASQPARLTVTWPDGTVHHANNLEANRYHRIEQGKP